MKAVKVRQDESCHWYVVPSDKCQDFDKRMSEMYDDDFEDQELIDEFEELYAQYRTGGDINNVQLYAEII